MFGLEDDSAEHVTRYVIKTSDKSEAKAMLEALDVLNDLDNYKNFLRAKLKHEGNLYTAEQQKVLEECRDMFLDLFNQYLL